MYKSSKEQTGEVSESTKVRKSYEDEKEWKILYPDH